MKLKLPCMKIIFSSMKIKTLSQKFPSIIIIVYLFYLGQLFFFVGGGGGGTDQLAPQLADHTSIHYQLDFHNSLQNLSKRLTGSIDTKGRACGEQSSKVRENRYIL